MDMEFTGASNVASRLSVGEKLHFVAKTLAVTMPCIMWNLVYEVLFHTRALSSRPFRITLMKCALRATRMTLREQRAIAMPTGVVVAKYCKSRALDHEKVLLVNTEATCTVEGGNDTVNVNADEGEGVETDGPSTTGTTRTTTSSSTPTQPPPAPPQFEFRPAMLHFVGLSGKKKALVYFHGGGYTMPLTSGQLQFALLAAERADMSLVVLEYTLSPQLPYPGQLAQAAAALRYLLKQRAASDIIIMGDSAGANMCLGLLAHLHQPRPHIQPIFTPGEKEGETVPREQQKLGGALCISPRCANNNNAASYRYNQRRDIISGGSIEEMNKAVENWASVVNEVWNAPISGGKEFWKDIMAHRLLLVVGLDEVYVDDVKKFGAMIDAKDRDETNAPRQIVVCPGELHVQAILDVALHCSYGLMLNTILSWLQDFTN